MDKRTPSSLFVNDGSFMERFKQLQQEKEKDGRKEKTAVSASTPPATVVSANLIPNIVAARSRIDVKANDPQNSSQGVSGGKLAFSLKQKSKLATPVKLCTDDEDEETAVGNELGDTPLKRQKLSRAGASEQGLQKSDIAFSLSTHQHWCKRNLVELVASCYKNICIACHAHGINQFSKRYAASPPPIDPTVKKVADRLANFVAKHGRQLEHVTRQKNPGDTPFKFLFDETCANYKYYEYRLAEEEKVLQQSRETQVSRSVDMSTSMSKSSLTAERLKKQASNYCTPASALYEDGEQKSGESSASVSSDPIAMMEFYMKRAAQEERRRKPKMSKDEMPPPPSLQGPSKRGHHMGDYIPPKEMEKFLSSCNDAAAQRAAREAAENAKIQADNVGHKLLSKMGWKEGEGLGSSNSGIANPILAGDVKTNNLGVGAHQPGEVTAEDDIYEQYKKRMMLGYRHRPNPLNNPRKAYY